MCDRLLCFRQFIQPAAAPRLPRQKHLCLDFQGPLPQHEPRDLEGSARCGIVGVDLPKASDRRAVGISVGRGNVPPGPFYYPAAAWDAG